MTFSHLAAVNFVGLPGFGCFVSGGSGVLASSVISLPLPLYVCLVGVSFECGGGPVLWFRRFCWHRILGFAGFGRYSRVQRSFRVLDRP